MRSSVKMSVFVFEGETRGFEGRPAVPAPRLGYRQKKAKPHHTIVRFGWILIHRSARRRANPAWRAMNGHRKMSVFVFEGETRGFEGRPAVPAPRLGYRQKKAKPHHTIVRFGWILIHRSARRRVNPAWRAMNGHQERCLPRRGKMPQKFRMQPEVAG